MKFIRTRQLVTLSSALLAIGFCTGVSSCESGKLDIKGETSPAAILDAATKNNWVKPTSTPSPAEPSPSATPAPDYPVPPNDPNYSLLWGLNNTGQTVNGAVGTAKDAQGIRNDINAEAAWKLKGVDCTQKIVAVLDTGVDYDHVDLKNNMWTDSQGRPGYDAVASDPSKNLYEYDPMDEHYHGTHCAGTIAAEGNNSTALSGVCMKAKIMAVRILAADGSGTIADAVEGIHWAVDQGAHVLSNSWGGPMKDDATNDAIAYAKSKKVLFIAAAGNDRANIDTTFYTPASYSSTHDNVITVAAVDNKGAVASFSNYSSNGTRVQIAAPGVHIWSAVPTARGSTKFLSGTSMAAPHVSGAATYIWSQYPDENYLQIKARMLNSAPAKSSLSGKVGGNRWLDLHGAVQ